MTYYATAKKNNGLLDLQSKTWILFNFTITTLDNYSQKHIINAKLKSNNEKSHKSEILFLEAKIKIF